MSSEFLFLLNSSFISHLSLLFLAATVENILLERVRNTHHNHFVTYIIISIVIN